MNTKELIKNTFGAVLALTIIIFVVVLIAYGCSGIASPLKEALIITIGFFGGFATLGAAFIAAYLFNDWRDQHNKQVKNQFSLSAFNQFEIFKKSIFDMQRAIIKLSCYVDMVKSNPNINQDTIPADYNAETISLVERKTNEIDLEFHELIQKIKDMSIVINDREENKIKIQKYFELLKDVHANTERPSKLDDVDDLQLLLNYHTAISLGYTKLQNSIEESTVNPILEQLKV